MYNWMKWLRLLGGWHFIAATAIKPPKAACQFAADDILLYEVCYYNPMDLLHHLGKGKEELSPLQYHIKSEHIISRHYKKSLLRSQIYHWYEELSMDTNYPIWRRQERRSKYAVQLASWQLRSNSPKTSICLSVFDTFFTMFLSSYHHEISEVITIDKSDVHAKGQGQRSKVKLTEVMTPLSRFWTVTPVWIHIW